jgi:hypothetical protein
VPVGVAAAAAPPAANVPTAVTAAIVTARATRVRAASKVLDI